MRTANKSSLSRTPPAGVRAAFLVLLGAFFSVAAFPVHAADPMPAMGVSPSSPPVEPATASGGDLNKTVTALEDKASEDGRNAVRRLDTAGPLTFEDLNSARQTITRIEAMIEVEKRLSELNKLRNDHGGISATSLAGAIPASALRPPPAPVAASAAPPPEEIRPRPVSSSALEVSRISGTEGRYEAVLKSGDGNLRTVKVGDQALGGGIVQWISPSAVGIEEKGETHILRVKNIDAVYTAMR